MPDREAGLAYKWKVMITVAVGVWMIVLDTTVVNVAFPTIRRTFGAGVGEAQWVISIYVLALGIATPLAGFLSDRFGIKRVYLTGLCVFVLGSLLSGLAPSLGSLIAARALQGVGGGITQTLGVAMLFMAFPSREQGFAFGIFGVVMVGAPALGPILGGLLVDRDLWRWIFFINIPVGAVGLALATLLLKSGALTRTAAISFPSIFAAAAGFGGVLYAASAASRDGWLSPQVLGVFGLGLASLAVLVIFELRAREPLLELRLFRDRTFLTASIVGYVAVVALFGSEFLMPVYLQVLRGRTALQSGFTLLPLAVAAALVNPVSGRLYDKIGPRMLVIAGGAVLLVNTWQFAHLTASTSINRISGFLALRGVAISLIMQSTFTTALGSVPKRLIPRGSSLVHSTRYIAQALGVAVLAAVVAHAVAPGIALRPHEQAEARRLAPAAGFCVDQQTSKLCEQSLQGISQAYMFTFYAALLAMFLGARLPGWPSAWIGRGGLRPADSDEAIQGGSPLPVRHRPEVSQE